MRLRTALLALLAVPLLSACINDGATYEIDNTREHVLSLIREQPYFWDDKVNLYFGKRSCLDAVQTFVDKPLNKLTPEEDFMLGIMLGYDISMQCERYCKRKFHLSGLIA